MVMSFAEAVEALYRAPLDGFVAERKRLATELKANADKPGAARLVKLARPPISTWVVNQLWWQARDVFDQLFASAARLRAGDLRATPAHREAIAALRTRATAILTAAGHAATDATLRRVTTNLSALAAAGGFEPDFAGALAVDREAPGFDAAGLGSSIERSSVEPEQYEPVRGGADPEMTIASPVTSVPRSEPANQNQLARAAPHSGQLSDPEPKVDLERQRAARAERLRVEEAERLRATQDAERLRAAEEAERLRVEEAERQRAAEAARLQAEAERQRQEAKRRAERQQVQEEVRSLNGQRQSQQRETERLRQALALAEQELERVHARLATLDARLAELDE
jgi:flagellar biosynthesis GTPase FlhF